MMSPLIVALMMTALSTEVSTTRSLKSSFGSEDQAIIRILRDLSHVLTLPSAKISGKVPADQVGTAHGNIPRAGWWIAKVVFPPSTKKHQAVSSYNLNSFGLRYGK
ncbi:metastasis-suppressor KiSS-1 [Embiotoca jacksoni]|uniref:metastasis-suppressor KiSS-1 n=1 Tax=Embiotoca jacksoni TaxID=100190 RepID=UPI003703EA97